MAEYIEREPMIEEIQRLIDNVSRNFPKATETELIILKGKYEAFMEYIKEQPAADVKPAKYSSWEYRTYPIVDRDGVARSCMRGYVCKACGHGEPEEKRFCGGCGAEMRGDENG